MQSEGRESVLVLTRAGRFTSLDALHFRRAPEHCKKEDLGVWGRLGEARESTLAVLEWGGEIRVTLVLALQRPREAPNAQ